MKFITLTINLSTTERVEANIEDDKVIASTLGESVIFGPHRTLFRTKTFCVLRGSQSDLQIQPNQITEWQ